MNVKNFSNNTGAENYAAHMARQINTEEESTMNSNESRQGILKTISSINPTRLVVGLALGAALLTATALTLGSQANADSLYKTTTIQTTQDYSDDEWIFGSPFIEVNPGSTSPSAKVASVAELSIIADHEFVFGAPYVDVNPGAATIVDLSIIADDEFMFGSPFVDTNLGTFVTPGV